MKLPSRSCPLIAAGVITLVLSGCGDEPPPKPVAIPPSAPAAEAKPSPAPEKPTTGSSQANPDGALAARVKSALAATAGLNAHRIDVTAKEGAVTLFGTAETKAQREAAAKATAAVAGVKSVENKLAVVAGS